MRKFLIRILIYSIPSILFIIPALIILKTSGESYTRLDKLLKNEGKYLIGYVYDETNYKYLKWKEIDSKPSKQLLALGSSRILQFRDSMFNASFYNAGYMVERICDFTPFLLSIPKGNYPDILIISLDQWMFNENWDEIKENCTNPDKLEYSFKRSPSSKTLLNVWSDFTKGKYNISILYERDDFDSISKVGLNAIMNDTGFRNDGSFFYGKQIEKLTKAVSTDENDKYMDTYSRIDAGTNRFEYGSNINARALEEIDRFLEYCQANGIFVVAILPPFATEVNDYMKKCGNYIYMDKIFTEANIIFEKYHFELWDMSDLSKYYSSDHETIDGFHGGEVTYLRMLIYMTENGSKIKEYTELERMNKDLAHRVNDFVVYH